MVDIRSNDVLITFLIEDIPLVVVRQCLIVSQGDAHLSFGCRGICELATAVSVLMSTAFTKTEFFFIVVYFLI